MLGDSALGVDEDGAEAMLLAALRHYLRGLATDPDRQAWRV